MDSVLRTTAKSRIREFLAGQARAGRNRLHGFLFAVTRMGLVGAVLLLVPLLHAILPATDRPASLADNSAGDPTPYTSTISEQLSSISVSSISISPDGCNLARL